MACAAWRARAAAGAAAAARAGRSARGSVPPAREYGRARIPALRARSVTTNKRVMKIMIACY